MHFERQLRAAAGESALGGADDLLRAAAAVEVVRLAVRRRGQKIARRYIAGENVQPLIKQEEALPHVLRDRGKVAPRLSERFLLLADETVLRADARKQRLRSRLSPGKLGLRDGIRRGGAEQDRGEEQKPHTQKELSLHGALPFSGVKR